MTVAELIAALQDEDPHAEVLVAVDDLDGDVYLQDAVTRRVEGTPSAVRLRSEW